MARRSREHGWTDCDGVTHSIDTRKTAAYRRTTRSATCGRVLDEATRSKFDAIDCMACIAIVTRRPRLEPRPAPNPGVRSWWMKDGTRHAMSERPWVASCGASLRTASRSANPINCVACGATPVVEPTDRRPEKGAD